MENIEAKIKDIRESNFCNENFHKLERDNRKKVEKINELEQKKERRLKKLII